MLEDWRKLIVKELRLLADKFDAGTSEVTETQAMDIINMLTHIPMNKEMACKYLNMSRSKFDSKVQDGLIPKGRKRLYSKEKVWWRDELDECKKK